VIFIIFSMVLIAACLYLPRHIAFVTNRAWFYYHGEDSAVAAAKTTVFGAAGKSTTVVSAVETAKAALGFAGQETGREL
jgi:hypothetical protein